jgi:hypothetical protein
LVVTTHVFIVDEDVEEKVTPRLVCILLHKFNKEAVLARAHAAGQVSGWEVVVAVISLALVKANRNFLDARSMEISQDKEQDRLAFVFLGVVFHLLTVFLI